MSIYVDSFEDDSFEIVIDEKEGLVVELGSNVITWSEIAGDITKNKAVVKFLSELPMLPDIPVEGKHIVKAIEGEAVWEEDNLATRDELALAKEELQADIDTKQVKGDYALKSELPDVTPYATNEALTTAKEELQANIDTKQVKGNYALKSELPATAHLATKTELANVNEALTTSVTNLENTKQAKGDYALKSELTPLATKVELNNTSQALQKNIDGKQAKGDYALKSQIPDVSGYATKTQLSDGLSGKQDKGDYVTKSLYDQTNESFQNALNNKQAKGDYVTNTELNNKGFLTSYTETDPVYLSDKPNIALKSDLPNFALYTTKDELNKALEDKQDAGNYALVNDIPDISNLVSNTDYGTANKAGIFKVSTNYGTSVTNDGVLIGSSKTADSYKNTNNLALVTKGTLENIKDDYVKRGLTENETELTADEKASAKQWLGYAEPTDIISAIAAIPQFKLTIVSELPETGEKMTLYFVPKTGTDTDVHDEYIWIEENNKYEYVGTTAVDLTGYVKNTDYATSSTAGVFKTYSGLYATAMTSAGCLYCLPKSLDSYKNDNSNMFIARGTLENIKNDYVKRAVTENDIELTADEQTSARTWLNAVGKEDYATKENGGIIKIHTPYGTDISSSGGLLRGVIHTKEQYATLSVLAFISKGTLDNVLTQYKKVSDPMTEEAYNALETKDANTLYLIEE
jgi:hypothetical protein